jgi:Zn-dependent metalloprotease
MTALVAAIGTSATSARTFHVDRTYDAVDAAPGNGVCADANGRCTLRAAVMESNAWPEPDRILLTVPGRVNVVYTFTIPGRHEGEAASGDLDILGQVEIRPDFLSSKVRATTIIDAITLDRVFHIGPGGNLWLSGVTLRNGDALDYDGGAIFNAGRLVLQDVTIHDSRARWGGAIASTGSDDTVLEDCTLSRNTADFIGGGAYFEGTGTSGSRVIRRTSILNNIAGLGGGGIFNRNGDLRVSRSAIVGNRVTVNHVPDDYSGGGGIHQGSGLLTVFNSTISYNTSAVIGGGIRMKNDGIGPAEAFLYNVTITSNVGTDAGGLSTPFFSPFNLKNSIVFANTPQNCTALSTTSLGNNVIGDATCSTVEFGDLPNTDPMLGPLQLNGGTTLNHMPLPGSPVIDPAGNACLQAEHRDDQRGVTRHQYATCDIGAIEYSLTFHTSQLSAAKLALGRLRLVSPGSVLTSYRSGFPSSVSMDVVVEGGTSVARAFNFLDLYSDFYLQTDPEVRIVHVRTESDPVEGDLVRFAQTFRGFPVYGAEIVVHLEADPAAAGAPSRVTHTSGMLMPTVRTDTQLWEPILVSTAPAITAQEAVMAAAAALGLPPGPTRGEPSLVIYDARIFGEKYMGPSGVRLAYRVTLGMADPMEVLVDAGTSEILFQHALSWSSTHYEHDLLLSDAAGTAWCPAGMPIADEGGLSPAYTGDPDAVMTWMAADATTEYFKATFDRISHDNDDAEVRAFINAGLSPAGAKASAGCGIGFSSGEASLDLFAHEFTHQVTHEESRLIYHGEAGALNEAFSDIMGLGLDPQDAVIGEDRLNGQGHLRDLAEPSSMVCALSDQIPASFPCPDHFSEYKVSSDDHGAVHVNSGIIGKAFTVMADGGGSSGMAGFGRTRMARLAYRTFTFLPRNAGFFDLRGATIAWAERFTRLGLHGFTSADVCTVRNAFAEVGIGAPDGDCDGVEDNVVDPDEDGIMSPAGVAPGGSPGPSPCLDGRTQSCDDNCPFEPNSNQANQDGDTMGDVCDPDDDNDGSTETEGPCAPLPSLDQDGDGTADCLDDDRDGDGVPQDGDGSLVEGDSPCPSATGGPCDDNCPADPNAGQADGNANGAGDACDPDEDGDGVFPDQDNCDYVTNSGQTDADMDGLGDACDLCPDTPDNRNAYHPGFAAAGSVPFPIQPDSDGDGLPDACDDEQFGDAAVLLDDRPYSFFNAVLPDDKPRTMTYRGPGGELRRVRLELPACDNGGLDALAPQEKVEVMFTGLPDSLSGVLEDGNGQLVASIRTSNDNPSVRGFRFRPRCDEAYFLSLATDAAFSGEEMFTVQAHRIVAGTVNPYTSDPPDPAYVPPVPLPDMDADGLWDAVDRCPSVYSPANRDRDGDGVGDECDICPDTPNPAQDLFGFETVQAASAGELSWATPVDYTYVWGPLSGMASYTVSGTGSVSQSNTLTIPAGAIDAWFLFKRSACGTWGSPARDLALP